MISALNEILLHIFVDLNLSFMIVPFCENFYPCCFVALDRIIVTKLLYTHSTQMIGKAVLHHKHPGDLSPGKN